MTAYRNNEVISAIFGRRSIRKFVPDQQVSQTDMHLILQAGLCAPSAANKRPIHLIIVKDRETLKALSHAKGEAEMIAKAQLAIVVCGDKSVEWYNDFLHEDCAAAVQNMLLCIHSLGLGAVWCGVPSILEDCLKTYIEKLGLPENIVPVATIAVGYPDEVRNPNEMFDVGKVHFEHW